MSDDTQSASRPFAEGDLCLLIDPKSRRHMLRLDARQHFHHARFGRLDHTRIIGRPPGFRVRGPSMGQIVCLRPTFEDFIMRRLKRRTQIIYPKDLGQILLLGDIFPGARVLESGIGSGAATATLLRYLGEGSLVSYERRQEFAQLALGTLAEMEGHLGPFQASHRVEVRDVYQGIDERELDAILLDVPEPHNAAPHAREALRPGGVLLCWLPTVLQVYDLARTLQEDGHWAQVSVQETLVRPWEVSEGSIRPAHRMVAHTGFLTRARRVEQASLEQEQPLTGENDEGPD